ncbi:hypothetical protein E2514_21835, partial [Salmonella enterica subsp. enterica serovar Alachua]|nr:hypothetical protein [Salmonella enterica subsp. enterica serovar Alachua]
MILLRPTPSETNNSNFGFEPASAGFFISVAIAAISAANLPPSLIKKGAGKSPTPCFITRFGCSVNTL